MSCDNSFSFTWLGPLVLALLSSLLAWDNINTWAANRSTIASLERARSDLRLEMDDSQADWSTPGFAIIGRAATLLRSHWSRASS